MEVAAHTTGPDTFRHQSKKKKVGNTAIPVIGVAPLGVAVPDYEKLPSDSRCGTARYTARYGNQTGGRA